MNDFLRFFSLSEPHVRYVLIGVCLFSIISSLVGTFAFLRKRSLIGDAVSHAVLPGICLAFIFFDTKNIYVLLLGASITGWLSILSIDFIVSKTKLKADAAIALVLSVFFGIGMLFLTYIQNSGNASQSGLNDFLFGSVASMVREDVFAFGLIAGIMFVLFAIFYKSFKIVSFDKDYAQSIGLSVRFIEFLLSTVTVLAVCIGIQSVGVVLMSAMLITPVVAARYWTNNLLVMMGVAVCIAVFSSICGAYISYTASHMPTGPWIIVVASCITFISVMVAPHSGFVYQKWRRHKNQTKIQNENILKALYKLDIKTGVLDKCKQHYISEISEHRNIQIRHIKKGLKRLLKKGFVHHQDGMWCLTDRGEKEAKRIVKIHRLWELYLTKYLHLANDHVHHNAEAIEHIINPELEAQLEKELDYPTEDPHGQQIIY